jgi:hypothetical protein
MGNISERLRADFGAVFTANQRAATRHLYPLMKWRTITGIVMFAVSLSNVLSSTAVASKYVRLDYNVFIGSNIRHTIFLELFDDRPLSQANFLAYVNSGK